MEYLWKQGLKVSRVALGTAQLGLKYGVANKTGKPEEKEIEKILATAFSKGINLLDTAYSYGDSERVIGRFLSRYPAKTQILVASKLPKLRCSTPQMLGKEIEQNLEASLRNLQVDYIPIYLLHDENDMTAHQGYAFEFLAKQMGKGKIGLLGVSVYTPEAAEDALENPLTQVIQVPFNVFDQRLNHINFFQRAEEKKKLVLMRSVFLQGLFFLLEDSSCPQQFAGYSRYFQKIRTIAEDSCFKVGELACKYAAQKTQGVILMGVESCSQLEENMKYISNRQELSPETMAAIEREFSTVPVNLIDPRQWRESR
jgi:aryl-alcohol dehydrogenase-like predicted oxidoreductase